MELDSPMGREAIHALKVLPRQSHKKRSPKLKMIEAKLHQKLMIAQPQQADSNGNGVTTDSKIWWQCVKAITGEAKSSSNPKPISINDELLDQRSVCRTAHPFLPHRA